MTRLEQIRFNARKPNNTHPQDIGWLLDRLDELREAAKKLLDSEWMMSHDWGGDRESVIAEMNSALAKLEE